MTLAPRKSAGKAGRKVLVPGSEGMFRPAGRGRTSPKAQFEGLRSLAEANGIQTSYLGMDQARHEASPETLRAILKLMRVPAENARDVRESLHEQVRKDRLEGCPPVTVAWDGANPKVEIRTREEVSPSQMHCQVRLENGGVDPVICSRGRLRQKPSKQLNGGWYAKWELTLPPLPVGFHQFQCELGGRIYSSLIISASSTCFSVRTAGRRWGLFLPLYAMHSKQSWGAGNFGDWNRLIDWTGRNGGSVVSTLPLLAAFLDDWRCEPSPYSPASRLFWNEFYLDIEAIPEFKKSKAAQKLFRSSRFSRQLEKFRAEKFIDYRSEMSCRRRILEMVAREFVKQSGGRRQQFEKYLADHNDLVDYAMFRAASERAKTSWHAWDPRMRYGKLQPGDYSEETKNYHCFVQWIAGQQMAKLQQTATSRGMGVYLDLPLGVNADGYDVWKYRESFAFPASAGAPPDLFFTKGQDWGFPPLNPATIRNDHYRYVRKYLDFQMRQAGMLRIDHVMGLHRLYWIPPGFPAAQGAYVTYPSEELYAVLSILSHRNKTTIVGENLGTVSQEVNSSMNRHALRGMYVVQYEQQPFRKALSMPKSRMVASLNTHDMPPFTAHCHGLDVADRADLGLIPPEKLPSVESSRFKLMEALKAFLAHRGFQRQKTQSVPALTHAMLEWLAATPAELLLVNLEDLWGEKLPQNVPGTCAERPNWRRKSARGIEQIMASKEIRNFLKRLDRLRSAQPMRPRKTGR
jgi:4-alpha-glucanotransferase